MRNLLSIYVLTLDIRAFSQCDWHDVNDIYSCQSNCKTIPSCNYFSMFDDAERNQKKCFHFAQCGEDCPECTTGTRVWMGALDLPIIFM